MSPEELKRRLDANPSATEFYAIAEELHKLPSHVVFELLFPIATTCVGHADALAAALLLELEPQCPVSCEDALRMLAAGSWQVSDHLVPFYLTTQFGKVHVLETVRLVATQLDRAGANSVTTIGYWASFPSVSRISGYIFERRRRLHAAAIPPTADTPGSPP
jgi:hypothetical protein